jgi:protein phosphatase
MQDTGALIIEAILRSRNRSWNAESDCLPPQKQVLELIASVRGILEAEDTLLKLTGQYVVVGDIHGNLDSLLRIFERVGYPPYTSFLFLGDYVDRGENSVEVMVLLFALKARYPNHVFLIRGNHEARKICKSYGFWSECRKKYSHKVFSKFVTAFEYMPLAAILNKSIFCVHGGMSASVEVKEDLSELARPISCTTQNDIVADVLWSDPRRMDERFLDSDRNCGCLFNESALSEFLDIFDCSAMIRGHENCPLGYEYTFNNNKCLTLFSSTNYVGQGNSAAVAIVERYVEAIEIFEPLDEESENRRRIILPSWLLESPEGLCSVAQLMVDQALGTIEL